MEHTDETDSLHGDCNCNNPRHVGNHNKLPRPPDLAMPCSDAERHFANVGYLPVDAQNRPAEIGKPSTDVNSENVLENSDLSQDSDSDGDDIEEMRKKTLESPSRLLLKGRQIIPHYPTMVYDVNNISQAAGSSISLPPAYMSAQHQDLVWLGSSLGTMHKVPQKAKRNCRSPSIDLKGPPGCISKNVSSCNFSSLTTLSSCGTDMHSFCRICQMPGDEKNPLISPCRCSGTLRYIHVYCLKKWIRISQRRGKKHPPRCELCRFQFLRHKQFKFNQWRWPRVRSRDKCLHVIFLLNLLIMIGCAIATIMCFLSDRDNAAKFPRNKVKLTTEEVITLTCGVMFFVAFFVAMTVEIKARHTIYKLFLRFLMHNTEWTVEQYDPSKDPFFKKGLMNVSQV